MSLRSTDGTIRTTGGEVQTSRLRVPDPDPEWITTEDDQLIFTEDGEAAIVAEVS